MIVSPVISAERDTKPRRLSLMRLRVMSSRDLDLGQGLSDQQPAPCHTPQNYLIAKGLSPSFDAGVPWDGRSSTPDAAVGVTQTTVIRSESLNSPCFSPSDPVSLGS